MIRLLSNSGAAGQLIPTGTTGPIIPCKNLFWLICTVTDWWILTYPQTSTMLGFTSWITVFFAFPETDNPLSHRVRQHSVFKSALQIEEFSINLCVVKTITVNYRPDLGSDPWLWHLVLCDYELVMQILSTLVFPSEKRGNTTSLINLSWCLDEIRYMENTGVKHRT